MGGRRFPDDRSGDTSASAVAADRLSVRRADEHDTAAIIDVCAAALEWADDDVDAGFFRWKHLENPFGRSPMWVAEDAERATDPIVGVRAMMRWHLEGPSGEQRTMTRAVDTATLPSHQGQGIFRRLTLAAVEQLADDGVAAVFNTPNDKSRPGYLKMGWETVGKVPVTVQPRNPLSLLAMARSKVAAEKWGIETDVGLAPEAVFERPDEVEAAIAADGGRRQWSTPISVAYLRWRTSFAPLQCRVEPLGPTVADGFIVFRLRRRGSLVQLSLLHVVGARRPASIRRAVRRLIRRTGADVAMASGPQLSLAELMVPLPGAGPLLTWRPLSDPAVPTMDELELPLGTIELF